MADEDEIEANRFAAEQLMPEERIREDARLTGCAAVDDDPVIGQKILRNQAGDDDTAYIAWSDPNVMYVRISTVTAGKEPA